MIADLEARLADVIGARMPAPFAGHAAVAPGPAPGANPALVVGTTSFDLVDPDFGNLGRPEHAPPATDPRRVVRLRCRLAVEVRGATTQSRTDQLQGLDQLLYLLDGTDFRGGAALVDGTDQGFALDDLRVVDGRAEPDPAVPAAPAMALGLEATGWFWPVGVVGATGPEILEIRLRELDLPLIATVPPIAAGGAPVIVALAFGETGTLRIRRRGSTPLPPIPFGSLALWLVGKGGQAGAGTLSGGTPGTDGTTLVAVTDGRASITYIPPATPATDTLVIAVATAAGGDGVELTRIPLVSR